VLYLFSGAARKADVRASLAELCKAQSVSLQMSEVDICRDPSMDLLDSALATQYLQQISDSSWDVVILTPPCSSFSRARCAQPGPKPVRSRLYPLGFPWLSDAHRLLVEQGNEFIFFSFQVCTAALSNSIPFLLEHPEDLGAMPSGHTPASIWQLPEARALFQHENVFTFALYQCQHGASTPKPTRFLTSIRAAGNMPHLGPPRFDATDRYAGPLPRFCGHRHKDRLLGPNTTAASAAYPAGLCSLIATWVFSVFDGGGNLPMSVSGVQGPSDFLFSFSPKEVADEQPQHPAEQLALSCLRCGKVSSSQLLRLSELLPDEERIRRAAEVIEGQRSFTSGAFVHQDKAGVRRNLTAFPLSSELLARLLSGWFPGKVFSSLAFFRDLKQPLHRDTTNGSYDNLLLACSEFSGGGLRRIKEMIECSRKLWMSPYVDKITKILQ